MSEGDQVLAVTSYNLSVFLHVSAVMIGFGATWAEAVMFPVASKMSPRHLPYVHRLQLAINRFLAAPAILIVAGTGVYQVSEGNWRLGDVWVSGTIGILAAVALILVGFFIPMDRKLLPMVEREIADLGGGDIELSQLSAQYIRKGKLEGGMGALLGVLLLVAAFLMTTKPGL